MLCSVRLAHQVHFADEDAVPEFATPLLANEQDLVDKMRATIENAQNNAVQRRNWDADSLGVLEHRLQAIVQVDCTKSSSLCCCADAACMLVCFTQHYLPVKSFTVSVQSQEPNEEDACKRNLVLQQVNKLVTDGLRGWHGMHVAPYGSFVSGLYTSTGDLDISIEGIRIL